MSVERPTREALVKLEHIAIEVARELGHFGLKYFDSHLEIEKKRDRSLVSQADRAIELKARELLSKLTPDFGFLGEEFGKSKTLKNNKEELETKREAQGHQKLNDAEQDIASPVGEYLNLHDDLYWMLDPIDGTINFIAKSPLWTTLLALIYKGEPILGVVAIPCIDEVFIASSQNGSRYGKLFSGELGDFKPCHPKADIGLSDAHLSSTNTSIFVHRGTEAWLQHLLVRPGEFRTHSDAYGYTRILCGGIDAMVDAIVAPYDVAAVQILFDETPGAFYSTLQGHQGSSRYQMGSVVVASNERLGRELLESYWTHLKGNDKTNSHVQDKLPESTFAAQFSLSGSQIPHAKVKTQSQQWLRAMETAVAYFKEDAPGHFIEDVSLIVSETSALKVSLKNGQGDSPPESSLSSGMQIRAVVAGGTGLVTLVLPETEPKTEIILRALILAKKQADEQDNSPSKEILSYREHAIGHFGKLPWGTQVNARDFQSLVATVAALHKENISDKVTVIQSSVSVETENRIQFFLDGSQQTITRAATSVGTTATAADGEEKRKARRRLHKNTLPSKNELFYEELKKDLVTVQIQARELLDAVLVPENISYDYLAIDADLLGLILHEALGHAAEGDLIQLKSSGFGKDGELLPLQVAPEWVDIVIDGGLDNCGQQLIDAEGTPALRKKIVKNGILIDAIHTRQTARQVGGIPDGCARMESVFHPSLNRMTSIWVQAKNPFPLPQSSRAEDIDLPSPRTLQMALENAGYLGKDQSVLFLSGWKGGTASCTNLEFRADVARIYLIRKDAPPVMMRDANFTGIATECFRSAVAAFGPTLCRSVGVCGKDGQGVYTSDGGPSIFLMKQNSKVQVIGSGEASE